MIERGGGLGLAACGLAAAIVFTNLAPARAADGEPAPVVFRVREIEIIDPWARSILGDAHRASVFFEFRNHAKRADQLVGATSPLASGTSVLRAAPHRAVAQIEIPSGAQAFELSEAGYYIELNALNVPLTLGKEFPVTLHFAQAGALQVLVTSRFHSPTLARRIREAAQRGDTAALRALRP